jgi:hypothetical protein
MAASSRRLKVPIASGPPARLKALHITSDADAEAEELLFWTSPIDDSLRRSSDDAMLRYISKEQPSLLDTLIAKPNSWSPLTKLDICYSVLKASGRTMPHAQLLNRIPPRAFTLEERRALFQGDHRAFGRLVIACAEQVNLERRQAGKKPVKTIHLFGAGITQRTIGAARHILEHEEETGYQLGGLAVLNTSLDRGLLKMTADHLTQANVNEPSRVRPPDNFVRVEKFKLREAIDGKKSEPTRFIRQAKPIIDPLYTFVSIHRPQPTIAATYYILEQGRPMRSITGMNTASAVNTLRHLPVGKQLFKLSTVVGLEGQKVSMGINENPGVTAISSMLGVRDYDQMQAAA